MSEKLNLYTALAAWRRLGGRPIDAKLLVKRDRKSMTFLANIVLRRLADGYTPAEIAANMSSHLAQESHGSWKWQKGLHFSIRLFKTPVAYSASFRIQLSGATKKQRVYWSESRAQADFRLAELRGVLISA